MYRIELISGFRLLLACLVVLVGALHPACAQLLTSDNVTLTVRPGVQVTVKGDVLNRNNAAITNNGTMDLSGNWIHNAANNCFGASQGTVILNGANQSIGGSQMTVFNNLVLAGSGTKIMLIDITTGGAYAVPAGVTDVGDVTLDLNGNTMYVVNSATGAITYGTGYILSEDVDHSSKVNWGVNAIPGAHTIPFGNAAGVQIPFTFDLTAGNAGEVVVSTYPTAPANTPFPTTPVAVTHVRNVTGSNNSAFMVDRFWQVDPSGTPTATLSFTYAPAENAANGNTNLRAQRWNDPTIGWSPPTPGQTNPTSQSVRAPGITTFGPWTLALDVSPLPVELLSFEANPAGNKRVECRWITASEVNNDYFTVERSRNGIVYADIGRVEGAGNSSSPLHYALTDHDPYKGLSYYRLRQTDFDGTVTHAGPVAVRIMETGQVYLYPNPGDGNLFLVTTEPGSKYQVHDMSGRMVTKGMAETAGTMHVDLTPFAKGVYSLVVTSRDRRRSFRVVIQ